jgi:hypothetical protein
MIKNILLFCAVIAFIALGSISFVFGLLLINFYWLILSMICYILAMLIWHYNELNNSNYY